MLAGRAPRVHARRQALPIEIGQMRLCEPLGQGLARRSLGELEPFEGTGSICALGCRAGSPRATSAHHPTPHSDQRMTHENPNTGQNRKTGQAKGKLVARTVRAC
jgi:hypothetical protein